AMHSFDWYTFYFFRTNQNFSSKIQKMNIGTNPLEKNVNSIDYNAQIKLLNKQIKKMDKYIQKAVKNEEEFQENFKKTQLKMEEIYKRFGEHDMEIKNLKNYFDLNALETSL